MHGGEYADQGLLTDPVAAQQAEEFATLHPKGILSMDSFRGLSCSPCARLARVGVMPPLGGGRLGKHDVCDDALVVRTPNSRRVIRACRDHHEGERRPCTAD